MRSATRSKSTDGQPGHSDLCSWLQSPLGERIRRSEREHLRAPVAGQYGRHLAQHGCPSEDIFTVSAIPHQLHIADHPAQLRDADLIATPRALPLQEQSLDALILHHSLETGDDPHGTLREAERVLAGEGLLLILGFNPWCWWGLSRLLGRGCPPRDTRLVMPDRLCDWLKLLDLEVEKVETFFSLPPLHSEKLLQRLAFLQRLDKIPLRPLHALYLLQARKHIAPLTPTRLRWQQPQERLPGGLAEPTASRKPSDANLRFRRDIHRRRL